MMIPLQNLPVELTLHIHSYHDTFRQDFQQKVLPHLQDHIRTKLLNKKPFTFFQNFKFNKPLTLLWTTISSMMS